MKTPRTRKDMIAYLKGHFRYDTMNGWNRTTSYAVNIKLHHLTFPDKETENRAWDLLEVDQAFYGFHKVLREFAIRHDYRYQIGTNGRSGGYLVLYNGGRKATGHKSQCDACGQLNFKTVEETGNNRCGKCGQDERENLAAPVYEIFMMPGQDIDGDTDFEDMDTSGLKYRVDLVMDFDRTCAAAVKAFIDFCVTHKAEEEEILVPKTRTVARRIKRGKEATP